MVWRRVNGRLTSLQLRILGCTVHTIRFCILTVVPELKLLQWYEVWSVEFRTRTSGAVNASKAGMCLLRYNQVILNQGIWERRWKAVSSWLGRKKHSLVRRHKGILGLDGTGSNLFSFISFCAFSHPLRKDRSMHFGQQRKGKGLQLDSGEKN